MSRRKTTDDLVMKLFASGFVVVVSLATLTGISLQTAQAQITSTQRIRLASPVDYHLIHTPTSVYRYDSRTGTTALFASESEGGTGKNIKCLWFTLQDPKIGTPGEPGKYEVSEMSGGHGILVRLDTTSGRTWVAITAGNTHWEEVTAK